MSFFALMRRAAGRGVLAGQRILFSLLRAVFLRNRDWYFDRYFGSDNPALQWVKTLVAPSRLATRAAYGQFLPLPDVFVKARSIRGDAKAHPGAAAEARPIAEQLRREGIVILPGRYAVLADHILARYKIDPNQREPRDRYERTIVNPSLDPGLLKFCVDPFLLLVVGSYWGRRPFLRHYPGLNVACPDKSTREIWPAPSAFASDWHFDTPNLFSGHLMLTDTGPEKTHMLYAKASHRLVRTRLGKEDAFYSERYVRDHYEVSPCIGPKGTLTLFDNGGLHRAELVKGPARLQFEVYFTPGNHLISVKEFAATKEPGLHFDAGAYEPVREDASLSDLQRAALSGLR